LTTNLNKLKVGAIAASLSIAFCATTAQASHFRGAALVPSVDANGLLTVDAKSFWRRDQNALPGNFPHSGVGTINVAGVGSTVDISISQDISDEATGFDRAGIVFEDRVEVVSKMPCTEPNELVKPLPIRVVREVFPVMPFPKQSCIVAVGLEKLCHRGFFVAHDLQVIGNIYCSRADVITAG